MSKEAYIEKLRRPEWQKKRLAVLNHAKFRCQICGSKTNTLNVHHSYYSKGKEPWEYPTGSMIAACEDCHGRVIHKRAAVAPIIAAPPEAVSVQEKDWTAACMAEPSSDHALITTHISGHEEFVRLWKALIEKLRSQRPVITFFIRSARHIRLCEDVLTVTWANQYAMECQSVSKPKNLGYLQTEIERIYGKPLVLKCQLDS